MSRPIRAEICRSSLQHNLQRVRATAPNSKIMAVIKANAYGHGMARAAHALHDADAFAVASIEEAMHLRESGVHADIVLLEGMFSADELLLVQAYDVQLVVHCAEQVEWLESAQVKKPIVIWLKLDTGMNRLGIDVLSYYSQPVREMVDSGLMKHTGEYIRLTRRGRLLSNEVFWRILPGN